jgi:hypothetical protein
MRSKTHTALTAPLFLHHTWIANCPMKNLVSMASCGIKLFLIVIHRFSLEKAAMNAPRICKMRNGVNLTKCLNFLIQVRNEYSPQPSKLLYKWQFNNKQAL